MANKGHGSSSGTGNGLSKPSSTRLASRKQSSKKGGLTWGDGDSAKLQELVWRATEHGALVSFSKTSDGGALVLYLKEGHDEAKEYPASEQELDIVMDDLIETYALN